MANDKNRICPMEHAHTLDNWLRKLMYNPRKILKPFINEGMTVLDIGCGPGFFSVEAAKLAGGTGKVLAADLQEGMLRKLDEKIKGTELAERVRLIKCEEDNVNVAEKADFILAFWVAHEVRDTNIFFKQLKSILKEKGQLLIAEPKLFHVTKKEFKATLKAAEENGFKFYKGPKILLSWSGILKAE